LERRRKSPHTLKISGRTGLHLLLPYEWERYDVKKKRKGKRKPGSLRKKKRITTGTARLWNSRSVSSNFLPLSGKGEDKQSKTKGRERKQKKKKGEEGGGGDGGRGGNNWVES